MLHRHKLKLSWMVGALLLLSPIAFVSAQPSPSIATEIIGDADFAADEAFQTLVDADVVYLGEIHASPADHAAQLAIITALYGERQDMAIALEMVQRPFQPVVDRYLAGEISEADLVVQTEYEQRWGFDWEYYAPILRFAKAHQLPVIAANAPAEITRQVARQGLDSLAEEDFRYIPDRADIDTSNSSYSALVREAFAGHGAHGNFNFDNFFAAQVVWDETMAESIVEFKQANPETLVVMLAGQGHVIYGYGIPDRVSRRLGSVNQQTVLLNPAFEQSSDGDRAIADILWYSP